MPICRMDNDRHIHYRLIPGRSEHPYVIFLHEGLGSISMWKDYCDRLCRATGFSGLVYDRLGFGQSSADPNKRTIHYLHHSGLVELPAVLEALLPGKPYWLVGQSDGASIALMHAAERPQGLLGIICEAPHVMVESITIEGIRRTVGAYDERMQAALAKYHGAKAQRVFDAWHRIWLSNAFRSWNIEYLLPSVQCPCLIIQGEDDPYGTAEHAHRIASGLSGPTRLEMIPRCGHAPHSDAVETVLELMTVFIAEHTLDEWVA